jgi:DNA polymerase sigma
MSSDCFVHMVVHLLQRRGVLPCLQSLYPPHPMEAADYLVDGSNTYFFTGPLAAAWNCQNQESVGELIVAFFKYFATEFPYVHGVASTRVGTLLSKEEKGWTKEIQIDNQRIGGIGSRDRFWLCIEDPMDVGFNVCRSVDKEALFEIRGEFIR